MSDLAKIERQYIYIYIYIYIRNLWVTVPNEATPVNQISATGWLLVARRDNVINITLLKYNNVDFLNQIRYFSIK